MTGRDVPLDAEELVLVTRGRRTGRPHEVTLWFARDGDALWLRADRGSDWYRNLVHDGRGRVRVGGVEADAELVPVADEAAALQRLVALWREKYGVEWVADWYVERGRVPVRVMLRTARPVRP
jgi:deazaflavin-dependent oxidoreductase (nitroreductase family)